MIPVDRPARLQMVTAVMLFSLCAVALGDAQTPASVRVANWQDDLTFLARELSARQTDFATLYPRQTFDAEIASLRAGAGHLTDAEIVLRLIRLVASAHVGHNHVGLPLFTFGLRRLPVSVQWFADGLAVVGAAPAYETALGARVLRAGPLTADELLTAAAPYVAHENDAGLRQESPGYLTTVDLLQQIRVADPDGRVTFTLVKPGGEPFTLTVTPAGPIGWHLLNAFDATRAPAALYRSHPDRNYWFEFLESSRTLYVQCNRGVNDPALPFKTFADHVFAVADQHVVERVVVDLRFNGGGIDGVTKPLRDRLRDRPALRSRVFVLIGAGSFSSGLDDAFDFRRDLRALLIGEPTSENLNSYTNVRTFTLPHSGLVVQYSRGFDRLAPKDATAALEPDVLAHMTLEDALAGRDPALDAALRAPVPVARVGSR